MVMGGFHPEADTPFLKGVRTVILVGPDGPHMWPIFTASPEYQDGAPDPLDRWSKRVIGTLARGLDAGAIFPSDGPPYPPFFDWALQSGQAFSSPIRLLCHTTAGLMVSYRGALTFSESRTVPEPTVSPCDRCAKRPCLSTCPAGALGPDSYDVPTCQDYIRQPGSDCMAQGCLARRVCPVSQSYGRPVAQSAFHMEASL